MKYIEDKKRVIVMDDDITTITEPQWKNIMRHVLGRHYKDIKRRGAGWTFPIHSLDIFRRMVAEAQGEEHPSSIDNTQENIVVPDDDTAKEINHVMCSSIGTNTETIPSKVKIMMDGETMTEKSSHCCDRATQTTALTGPIMTVPSCIAGKSTNHQYKFDVDESIRQFCQKWIQ